MDNHNYPDADRIIKNFREAFKTTNGILSLVAFFLIVSIVNIP
ncbi:hypothetical protein A28LD_1484 [Idiomarina sp. A28L]|nr:hypothetical protein A28LD_1484 [Idiomarina sp. A28L]